MEKTSENNSKENFLKESFKGDLSKHHKKYLGTTIPEGYFAKSKNLILNKIKEEVKNEKTPKKKMIFWMQPQFKYIAAASLVFMLGLTIWLQNSDKSNRINKINFEELAFSDDVLVESLLVVEEDFEAFTNTTLFNEILVKAELSEQKLDNLILNSLMVEDSLLDNYINDEFIETIIL